MGSQELDTTEQLNLLMNIYVVFLSFYHNLSTYI